MTLGKIGAMAVAMAVFVTSYQPAQAFVVKPVSVAPQNAGAEVIKVGQRSRRRGFRSRGHRRVFRGGNRRFRGDRYRRGRYIAGGLIAGALIGSVLAAPRYGKRPQYRPRYRRSVGTRGAHVNWCYNRFRSYRERDNTFQPYHGGRRPCISPYN